MPPVDTDLDVRDSKKPFCRDVGDFKTIELPTIETFDDALQRLVRGLSLIRAKSDHLDDAGDVEESPALATHDLIESVRVEVPNYRPAVNKRLTFVLQPRW